MRRKDGSAGQRKKGRKERERAREGEGKRGGKKARLASVEEQTHRLKAVVASGRAGRATQRQSTQLDDSSGREHSFATATISSFRMTRYYKTPACVLATTRWSKSKHPPATTAAPASNRYLRDPRLPPPRLFPKHVRFSPFLLNYQRNGTPTVPNVGTTTLFGTTATHNERSSFYARPPSLRFAFFPSLSLASPFPFLLSKDLLLDSIEFFVPSSRPLFTLFPSQTFLRNIHAPFEKSKRDRSVRAVRRAKERFFDRKSRGVSSF